MKTQGYQHFEQFLILKIKSSKKKKMKKKTLFNAKMFKI